MKQRYARCAGIVLAASMVSGCQAWRLEQQGIDFRHGLLNIYTEQVLDNLIRARRCEPFIQLEITELFAQEFDEIGVTGSFGETVTDARTLLLSGASSNQAARSLATAWSVGGNSKRQGTLNFKAKPITDRDAIYDAYITFANDPNSFKCGPSRPDKKDFHEGTLRHRDGLYYWVPKDAREQYRALFLRTTFQHESRGMTGFYAVRIEQVIELESTDEGDSTTQVIVFDRKVPAGEAILVVEKDGKTARIPLFMALDQEGVKFGDKTDRLEAEYSPAKRGLDLKDYKGRNARLYSADFPPEADSLLAIVESVESAANSLDRIQAAQPR